MTPKEKAKELTDKYYNVGDQEFDYSKEFALIAVDYILNSEPNKAYFIKGSWITPKTFWEQVKNEIEKL